MSTAIKISIGAALGVAVGIGAIGIIQSVAAVIIRLSQ